MQADLPPDAVVIRFKPIAPERVLAQAELEHTRIGRYWVSVFASARRRGESDEDVQLRLLRAAELDGISRDNWRRYFVCARAEQLVDRGFTFCKYDDEPELAEHYSVELGERPTLGDANRFLEPFAPASRRPA